MRTGFDNSTPRVFSSAWSDRRKPRPKQLSQHSSPLPNLTYSPIIQTDSTSGCGDEFERLKNRTNLIHAKAWLFIPDYLVAQFPLERGDASVLGWRA